MAVDSKHESASGGMHLADLEPMQGAGKEAADFLCCTKLGAVVDRSQLLLTTHPLDSVSSALRLMNEHRVVSLPVYDPKREQYVGVVDIFHIVASLALKPALRRRGSIHREQLEVDPKQLVQENEMHTFSQAVSHVLLSDFAQNPVFLHEDDTLDHALSLMCKGFRHVLVRTQPSQSGLDDGVRLLSQMDVVRFFTERARHAVVARVLGEQTVSEAGLLNRPVITLSTSVSALAGFRTLIEENVCAAPVIDEQGHVVETLSIADIRRETFQTVVLPVLEFLQTVRPPSKADNAGSAQNCASVTCFPNDSLLLVAQRAVAASVRRAWILDPQTKRLIGVVTVTDLLCAFGRAADIAAAASCSSS